VEAVRCILLGHRENQTCNLQKKEGKRQMTFHISYTLSSEQRNNAQKRFMETSATPPSGVTMTGRWHCAQGLKGFLVAEASDAVAIAKWMQEWTDLLSFEVTPVLTDEELARVIG
jgi:hypothetical protein